MRLVAFGDSFTAGYIDGTEYKSYPIGQTISYVARLCELPNSIFKYYENYARGGWSNHHIAWDVYNFVLSNREQLDNTFVLIAWTNYKRTATINPSYTDHPSNKHPYTFFGQNDVYPKSNKYLIAQTDLKILGVCELLRKHHVPFAMIQAFNDHSTDSFSSLSDIPQWVNMDKPNNTLMHIIAEHYLDPGFKQLDITADTNIWFDKIEKNQYITDCYHPSIQGHHLIASTLYPKLAALANVVIAPV